MKRIRRGVQLAGIGAFVILVGSLPLAGGSGPASDGIVITVCSRGCDYMSIQEAVDNASRGDTIELGPETFYENVEVDRKALTIQGAGPGLTIVDGGGVGAVFWIVYGYPQRLADMTIQNGGGGVGIIGSMTLDNCVVRDNHGLGIYTQLSTQVPGSGDATVVISNSLISGNSGPGVYASGLASYPWSVPELKIQSSTIMDNTGPGLHTPEPSWWWANPFLNFRVTIDDTTIADNTGDGGAAGVECSVPGRMSLSNSTVTDDDGPAFSGIGPCFATMSSVTLVGNGAGASLASWLACRYGHCRRLDPDVHMNHVIVTAGGGSACSGSVPVISDGHNISVDYSCGMTEVGDLEGEDPLLMPLDDYGGPTPTYALHPDSPAIDSGGDTCPLTDQRGAPRPLDGDGDGTAKCDIGAVENLPPGIDARPIGALQDLALTLQGADSDLVSHVLAALQVLTDAASENDTDAARSLLAFVDEVAASTGSMSTELAEAATEDAWAIIRQLLTSD